MNAKRLTGSFRLILVMVLALLGSRQSMAQGQAALLLNGYDGIVSIPESPSLVPSTGLTFEAWVDFDPTPISHVVKNIGVKGHLNFLSERSYVLQMFGGGLRWSVKTNVSEFYNDTSAFPAAGWHHVAGTHDGAIARLYVDGVQALSFNAPGSLYPSPGPLLIGGVIGMNQNWPGLIDEVRLWSVARTQAQIQQNRFHQLTATPGLVSSWRFNSDFHDSIGTNHGAAIGGVAFTPAACPAVPLLAAPALVPAGGTLPFLISSPVALALYAFDVSLTGTSPGVVLGPGVVIPLNPPFLLDTYGALIAPLVSGFSGQLDASGHAAPMVMIPNAPELPGLQISGCYVRLDASQPFGIGAISDPVTATVTAPWPSIASVTPATGPHLGGTAVTIAGANFRQGAAVKFGSLPATGVVLLGDGSLSCTSPAGTLGPVAITVLNPDGGSQTLAAAFTYVPTLMLDVVSPALAIPGATVTLLGAAFAPGMSVAAGGVQMTPSVLSPTFATCVVPPGVPCSTLLTIGLPDGQAASKSFNPAPTIYSTTGTAPASGGGSFVIAGSDFFAGSTVTMGGASAPIQAQTPQTLVVIPPPGPPGPAVVVVSSATGCSAEANFTYF